MLGRIPIPNESNVDELELDNCLRETTDSM